MTILGLNFLIFKNVQQQHHLKMNTVNNLFRCSDHIKIDSLFDNQFCMQLQKTFGYTSNNHIEEGNNFQRQIAVVRPHLLNSIRYVLLARAIGDNKKNKDI